MNLSTRALGTRVEQISPLAYTDGLFIETFSSGLTA